MFCLSDINAQIREGDTSKAAITVQRLFRYKLYKIRKHGK